MFEVFDYEEVPVPTTSPLAHLWSWPPGRIAASVPPHRDDLALPLRLAVVGFNVATALILVNPFTALAVALCLDGTPPTGPHA